MILGLCVLAGCGEEGTREKAPGEGPHGRAIQVSAGGSHTCAVYETGRVRCWGANLYGQLGNGSTNMARLPVQVIGLYDAVAVSTGTATTCAVRSRGEVVCWGDGSEGTLGSGSSSSRTPILVSAVAGVTAVSVGFAHACALAGGQIRCWGTFDGTPYPDFTDAVAVDAGQFHTCAARATGEAACWGDGNIASLGDGTNEASYLPVTVLDLVDATTVGAGTYHSCALRATGEVACWGGTGRLGTEATTMSTVPVPVSGLTDAVNLCVSGEFSCAVRATGTVVCWGHSDTVIGIPTPIEVVFLEDAVSVSCGGDHACALKSDGGIVCWGDGSSGQIGDGTLDSTLSPRPVP